MQSNYEGHIRWENTWVLELAKLAKNWRRTENQRKAKPKEQAVQKNDSYVGNRLPKIEDREQPEKWTVLTEETWNESRKEAERWELKWDEREKTMKNKKRISEMKKKQKNKT